MIKIDTDALQASCAKLDEAIDSLSSAYSDSAYFLVEHSGPGLGFRYCSEKSVFESRTGEICASLRAAEGKLKAVKSGISRASVMFANKETELRSRMCSEFDLAEDHVVAPLMGEKTDAKAEAKTGGTEKQPSKIDAVIGWLKSCTTLGGARQETWFQNLSFGKLFK